jgi:hypothetical protein
MLAAQRVDQLNASCAVTARASGAVVVVAVGEHQRVRASRRQPRQQRCVPRHLFSSTFRPIALQATMRGAGR